MDVEAYKGIHGAVDKIHTHMKEMINTFAIKAKSHTILLSLVSLTMAFAKQSTAEVDAIKGAIKEIFYELAQIPKKTFNGSGKDKGKDTFTFPFQSSMHYRSMPSELRTYVALKSGKTIIVTEAQ